MKPLLSYVTLLLGVFTLGVPAADAGPLGSAPVIFTKGDWSVRKTTDPMTDKASCTGLYQSRFAIQLEDDGLYVSLRGRGGVASYRVRFNDDPVSETRIPSMIEKKTSALTLKGNDLDRLVGASHAHRGLHSPERHRTRGSGLDRDRGDLRGGQVMLADGFHEPVDSSLPST